MVGELTARKQSLQLGQTRGQKALRFSEHYETTGFQYEKKALIFQQLNYLRLLP